MKDTLREPLRQFLQSYDFWPALAGAYSLRLDSPSVQIRLTETSTRLLTTHGEINIPHLSGVNNKLVLASILGLHAVERTMAQNDLTTSESIAQLTQD